MLCLPINIAVRVAKDPYHLTSKVVESKLNSPKCLGVCPHAHAFRYLKKPILFSHPDVLGGFILTAVAKTWPT